MNTENSTTPSIEQQTGWARPFPKMICQNVDVLKTVNQYSFDLCNPEFQEYCRQRGVLHKAGRDERFRFTANHHATRYDFYQAFAFAEEQPDGTRYQYTPSEMETHWQIMLAAKGAMQDCWELFNA